MSPAWFEYHKINALKFEQKIGLFACTVDYTGSQVRPSTRLSSHIFKCISFVQSETHQRPGLYTDSQLS